MRGACSMEANKQTLDFGEFLMFHNNKETDECPSASQEYSGFNSPASFAMQAVKGSKIPNLGASLQIQEANREVSPGEL